MTKYLAPALDKGLDILEFLSAQSVPQSQLEIANGIDRKPNEIYRMLMSLESRGYIAKDAISGKYDLTLRLFQLAHSHSPVDTIVRAAQVHMSALAHSIKQSVHLSVLFNNQLMIVAQAKSQTPVSLSVEVGSLFPLELTISGKSLLANLNSVEQKQVLKDSPNAKAMHIEERKALVSFLNTIKGKSCINQKSQLTEGVTDFAAPIFGMNQEVLAILAVSTLTSQMRKLVSEETIEQELIGTVEKIRTSVGIL